MMMDKRLWKEIPQAKPFIMKQVGMQWLSLLCNIGLVFLVSDQMMKTYLHTLTHRGLLTGFIIMMMLILLKMWFIKKQSKYSFLASKDVKDQLRRRMYAKLLRMRNHYQEQFSTSEIVQLSVEGIDQLETYFGRYLPQFFYSLLAPLTLFLLLVFLDAGSAFVLLICVPLIPISIVAIQKFAKRLLSKYWTSYANLGDSFLENLQGLTTLKIYQADGWKHEEMNQEAQHFRSITMKVLTMQLNSVSVMDIVAYGGAALGTVVALLHFMDGSISLASTICITLLSAEFFLPLRLLGSYFHIAMNGIAASDKIFRFLDLEEASTGSEAFDNQAFSIQMDGVSFRYDESKDILNSITLSIQAGQFVAIAGESGSGKSTLAKLLVGMEKGYQGSMQIQKKERSSLSDVVCLQEITYVSHNPFLMKGSVYDNLVMAKTNVSEEEMIQALKQVQLYDFLWQQEGLQTQISESGANLSGGQRQRLALARALLKDSTCYIFDEATSNIDVESEQLILELIQTLSKQKTVILITHRLSSIVSCDQIYMLANGMLQEQGNHEELMEKKALYYDLYCKQVTLEAIRGGASYDK